MNDAYAHAELADRDVNGQPINVEVRGCCVPTSADYELAADRYRSLAEQLVREAGEMARSAPGLIGADRAQDVVDGSLACARRALSSAVEGLTGLAVECDSRAEVCAEFRRAVERYRHLTAIERLLERPPSRPAPWVEL